MRCCKLGLGLWVGRWMIGEVGGWVGYLEVGIGFSSDFPLLIKEEKRKSLLIDGGGVGGWVGGGGGGGGEWVSSSLLSCCCWG